ncbi:MAG: hypothetical protein JWO36_1816 [Myxococcales bacterium]|nr:hypothetical protein [Myxococcales bacterium]
MKHRSLRTRALALATLLPFITTSCGSKKTQTGGDDTTAAQPTKPRPMYNAKDLPPGLELAVSNGTQGKPAFDHTKLAPATKLSDVAAQALLGRANPIAADATDTQSFALRPGSQPPPRTGETIKDSFPPPPSSLLPPPANDAGKDLEVLRFMPKGEVPLAPELSVTFSQPMVAVTSQSDAATTTPVKLTPQPKGKWRWIGTRTILFDPEIRFPQATNYQVEVPAGTKSVQGGVLRSGVKFTFETPAPKLIADFPSDYASQRLDVPLFILFDQKIDPQTVLSTIHVTVAGAGWDSKPALQIRLLDAAEIEQDKRLQATVANAKSDEKTGRWLAFRTVQPFPRDSVITVTVDAGTASLEGPNKTKNPQSFSFRTYAPLKVLEARCNWGSECPPGSPFVFQLNNQLDEEKFDDQMISITPEIPNVKIIEQGSNLLVQGMTKARTKYKVVVAGTVKDEFGQALGKPETHEFSVGDAYPTFYGPEGMVVLDPAAPKPTLDFFSTNYDQLKVKLYQVGTSDYDAYIKYMSEQWNHDHPPRMPGTKKLDTLVMTTKGHNELVETSLDLQAALAKSGLGHAIAVVEPYPWKQDYEPPRMIAWVQSTKLAVDAYVDADNLIAFASELGTGKPAANVALEIHPMGIKATTDDKGMATLPLGPSGPKGNHYLTAQRGDDIAMLTENQGYWSEYGTWIKQTRNKSLAWYVVDDRKMYKPGEEVTLKGWLRLVDQAKNGDVGGIGDADKEVTYTVTDSRGVKIADGKAAVSGLGGFDTKFSLPKTPNLGYANIAFVAPGGSYNHRFQIEEFRRPEFEVSAHASQGPFIVGDDGDVTVDAKYYSGGPLAGAALNWYVTASQTNFTPPNRDDFIFGNWQPWWGYRGWYDEESTARNTPPKTWSLASKTDATGAHILHMDFLSVNPAMPMSVTANASVTDLNRQAWSASSTMIVHPSSLYVGVKTKKPFVEKGKPFDVDVIGVDLDGKAVTGAKIDLEAVRLDWEYKKGKYATKEVDPQSCTVTASKDPVPCSFQTKEGGTYQITASIIDSRGRPNLTKLTFWVSGGANPPAREVSQELVQLIPDKKEYRAGNTAEVLIQAPFYPAEGIVSWRRSGIVKTERITIDGPTKVITVPITEAMVPNLYVQVDLVGMAARTDDKGDPDPKLPKRPAYAVGTLNLPVPPKQRTLTVTTSPSVPKLAPGEHAKIAVEVKDAAGQPVANAEAAVVVVDEAILSLAAYDFPNPIDAFYPQRGTDARDFQPRAYVKLAKPKVVVPSANGMMRRGAGMGGNRRATADTEMSAMAAPAEEKELVIADKTVALLDRDDGGKYKQKPSAPGPQDTRPAIAVRSNFNPLAAFSAAIKTDAAGRAVVDIKVPDNLTRYRIVALVAAGDKQFGKGESSLIARLPLMVRPSPPRFLNFGDTFRLPVIVQNQTDSPMTVQVAVRATNAFITDGAGREVSVPANDRVEVQFPAAADLAGTARFQVIAAVGDRTDAAEVALPVWTPATTEAFATYGVIDQGAVKQPVALPGQVVEKFGGLEVTTASTNLQSLTDALLYLVHYPYECSEQRSSRILAIAALRDVLAAFKTKQMPSAQAMEHSVDVDVEHLSQMQNYDGGYAYWDRGFPSEPYLSVFVTNALVHAKAKGFSVPQNLFDSSKPYLKHIENYYPWFYPKEVRWAISAYALYTRKQMGDLDIAKGKALFREAGLAHMTMETAGWLLGLFAGNAGAADERAAIVRYAMNHVSETAGAANFTTSYGDGNYLLLGSDRRVDGVMLESLIQEQPGLDLIPKLVTGLLAHRKAGRWLDTQENAFILLALDLYFHTYEKTTPDFVARVWLGNDYAGDHTFKGRTTEYHQIDIAMKDVAAHDRSKQSDLTIQKDGAGRLYYRVGMRYAPASLKLDPADYGFVVERRYEAIDDPKDVARAPDGKWHIKAGARVRVRITMVNENRRYHVALVDPMPAGLEAMNPELAVTGPIPSDPNEQKSRGAYWWWYGPWYEHQNMRDERIEAFAALLWEGVHNYDYVARATTPGEFIVPPPKAEEMYMPETFGRGGSDRVIIE